jgi:hypothetical protein
MAMEMFRQKNAFERNSLDISLIERLQDLLQGRPELKIMTEIPEIHLVEPIFDSFWNALVQLFEVQIGASSSSVVPRLINEIFPVDLLLEQIEYLPTNLIIKPASHTAKQKSFARRKV